MEILNPDILSSQQDIYHSQEFYFILIVGNVLQPNKHFFSLLTWPLWLVLD